MAGAVVKFGEALGDDLGVAEICRRTLAGEHQNGRAECCPEGCGLGRGDVRTLEPGQGFGGKVVISAGLYRGEPVAQAGQ